MASKQVFFEDVEVGGEILPLLKEPLSLTTIVKFAGASGDFAPLHHDVEFAKSIGLPNAIAHGPMKIEYLGQLMTNWIGDRGKLKKLELQMRGMDFPGEAITGKGRVVRKYVEAGENCVECEVWLENQRQITTVGRATVALPSRAASKPKGGRPARPT